MQFFDYINLQWLWWAVNIAYGITIISVIAVIVSENRNPVKSLAWVTVLLVVPLVGLVLYAVFGRNIQSRRMLSRKKRRRLRRLGAGCNDVSVAGHVGQTKEPLPGSVKPLAMLATALCGTRYYDGNSAQLFDNGREKFDALLRDIASAQRYINLQYYIIEDDEIGSQVLSALCESARAGVKVRIIYDHVGSFKLKKRTLQRLKDAGIEAYPFFKVAFPPFGTRINWRNHRKLVIIDGVTGYIGGMNIADRYVDGGRHFEAWRDLHLRIVGPAVGALQQSFAVDWNFMGQPMFEETAGSAPTTEHPVGMQLVVGGPTSPWFNMALLFQQLISSARQCVYIQTPYFIPSESLLQALQAAALSKIDVRVMLPLRSDSDMLRWASNSFIDECLRAGVKVYLYKKGMLHSKAIIVDNEFATVGSTNFDFRSFEHNFEANMLLYSKEFNTRIKEQFMRDQHDCQRVMPAEWRHRPRREKALESLMRLFAPIL